MTEQYDIWHDTKTNMITSPKEKFSSEIYIMVALPKEQQENEN